MREYLVQGVNVGIEHGQAKAREIKRQAKRIADQAKQVVDEAKGQVQRVQDAVDAGVRAFKDRAGAKAGPGLFCSEPIRQMLTPWRGALLCKG